MINTIIKEVLACAFLLHIATARSQHTDSIPIGKLTLPEGFKVEVYAAGLANAREMDFAEDGTLFIGTSEAGKVYAVTKDRKVRVIGEGLDSPAGVCYYKGDLYVAEVSRIIKYEDILEHLDSKLQPSVLNSNFPADSIMNLRYIRIGEDQKIYIPISSACNACIPESIWHGKILRMSLDGGTLEYFAYGVRYCLGIDWDPVLRVMWFTDIGRDDLGVEYPPDEINKAPVDGGHFGFPFLNGPRIDPGFWPKHPPSQGFITPKYAFPAHSGVEGMCFYNAKMFGPNYLGGIFVAEHGHAGRDYGSGCRITYLTIADGRPVDYQVFCSGWMQDDGPWGTPADVRVGSDGSLFISDDLAGCIYRIYK